MNNATKTAKKAPGAKASAKISLAYLLASSSSSVVKQCPFPLEELVSQFRFRALAGTEVYSN